MGCNTPNCIKMHVRASWFSTIFRGWHPRTPEREGRGQAREGKGHLPMFDVNRRPWSELKRLRPYYRQLSMRNRMLAYASYASSCDQPFLRYTWTQLSQNMPRPWLTLNNSANSYEVLFLADRSSALLKPSDIGIDQSVFQQRPTKWTHYLFRTARDTLEVTFSAISGQRNFVTKFWWGLTMLNFRRRAD
jgi:hypothetical protein